MHATRYKIWKWIGRVKDNRNPQYRVAILTRAKRSETNAYELANELLCTRLGLALNLPIPVGVILERKGELYYASLHVAIDVEGFPDATDEDLDAIAADEDLACGIIAFDSWLLNADRHCGNIYYDDEDRKTFVYDHGNAFYWRTGRQGFEDDRDHIAIDDHCLKGRIKSLWHFDTWHKRILQIPEKFIADSVELASEFGIPKEDVSFCVDYLLSRRTRLRDIFTKEWKSEFPKVNPDLLDPLGSDCNEDFQI
jgi:hypothetical protein